MKKLNNRAASDISRESYKTFMRENVFGIPEDLIDSIGKKLSLHSLGLSEEGCPLGCYLLTGDPGVGKTLTGYATAEYLHGNPKSLIHLEGENYKESHECARLVGAPPGYLGHRETPPLFSQTKLNAITSERSGLSVIVIDEMDKAHPMFSEKFLTIIERGKLTLGDNSAVNFERSLLFFTANWGSELRKKAASWGFTSSPYAGATSNAVQSGTHPAFISRIRANGGIFDFPEMSNEVREKIIAKELRKMENLLLMRRTIRVTLKLCDELQGEAMREKDGRNVAGKVKDFVNEAILNNEELILRTTGNNADLTKATTWEILPNFDISVRNLKTKAAVGWEGI